MVNEPSVFEPPRFDCILFWWRKFNSLYIQFFITCTVKGTSMKSTVIVLIWLKLEPYHDSFCFLGPVQTNHEDAKHAKSSLNLRSTPSLCLIRNARNVHSDVAQKKIQISAVWSESSLSTWRNFAFLAGLGLRCSHMACGPLYHVILRKIWATVWKKNVPSDMCVQGRLKSACASAQSDQSLRCPHAEIFHPWLFKMSSVKITISLRECAGWSEFSLGAHVRRYVFRCGSTVLGRFLYQDPVVQN